MKGFSGFGGINPAKDVVSFKPKFDPMKTIYAGTPEHKQFMKGAKKAISKKPTSFGSRAVKSFKNIAKGLGRRATGIAGMMMGTMGTADANPKTKGKMTFQEQRDLLKRVRNMKIK